MSENIKAKASSETEALRLNPNSSMALDCQQNTFCFSIHQMIELP